MVWAGTRQCRCRAPSAVTITLLIISIFMIVTGNMQEVTQNIEGSVKISAFVAYDHEEQAQLDMIQVDDQESGTCGQRGILKQGSRNSTS